MVQRGNMWYIWKKMGYCIAGHILDIAPGGRSHIRPNFWDIVNMMESIENHDFFYFIVYLNIGISYLYIYIIFVL